MPEVTYEESGAIATHLFDMGYSAPVSTPSIDNGSVSGWINAIGNLIPKVTDLVGSFLPSKSVTTLSSKPLSQSTQSLNTQKTGNGISDFFKSSMLFPQGQSGSNFSFSNPIILIGIGLIAFILLRGRK